MANRVYFASQGLSVGGSTVQGAQSVGISVNYSLEQAFQLGKLAIYDNIVTDGEVTVTASKNLDGSSTMFSMMSGSNNVGGHGATTTSIVVASETTDSGTQLTNTAGTTITGAYLSSLGYNFPSDGFATEEISWIADNKSATGTVSAPSNTTARNIYRHHVSWTGVHANDNVTNISISTDLGREAMFKLGQFKPYHRFANFPFEVTVEFTVANTGTDQTAVNLANVDCSGESGIPAKTNITVNVCATGGGSNVYSFTMSGCRLSALSQDGGDTGGGNASTTYTYTTYNSLVVSG